MKKSVSPPRKNLKDTQAENAEESGPSAIKNRVNALDVSGIKIILNCVAKF